MESVDIIIIGAGIAGLAAADVLRQTKKKFIVLEAQDRIGGRIWTDNSLGVPLDLGASWIHGTKRNPIAVLAAKYKIKTVPSNTESLSFKRYESLSLYDWDNKKVSQPEISQMKRRLEEFEVFTKDAQLVFDKDISYSGIIRKFLSFHRLTERELKIFKYAVKAAVEYEFAEDASRLSFLEFGKDEPFPGPDVLFPEGYGQLIEKLAGDLPIQLQQVVKKISYDENGVTVTTDKGIFQAKAALVTLPLGILKIEKTLFAPKLPRWKQQAINRLQMGLLNKVYLYFPEVFWDVDSDIIGYIPTARLSWIEFINYSKYIQKPILMAFNAGSRARQMEQWPAEKVIESIMQVMRNIYGTRVVEPLTYKITSWDQNLFARGSYSFLPVGIVGAECERLAEPILERVYFAGEATDYKMLGTVHGAYLSGIKAAKAMVSALDKLAIG